MRKNTDRLAESVSAGLLGFLNGIGFAKKFKPLPTMVLAGKMAICLKVFANGKHFIELEEIFDLLDIQDKLN